MGAEGTEVRVVGEAGPSAAPDPLALSEADVVLLGDEELLEEAAIAVAEDGTQALVLISDDDHAIPRLRALPLRGWSVVPPDAPPEELAAAAGAASQGDRKSRRSNSSHVNTSTAVFSLRKKFTAETATR